MGKQHNDQARSAQDEFLRMMSGGRGYGQQRRGKRSVRPRKGLVHVAGGISATDVALAQIDRGVTIRARKRYEKCQRADLVQKAGEVAQQSWEQTYSSKGRKASRRLSEQRGIEKRRREQAIEKAKQAAYAAWDEVYGQEGE